MFFIYCYLCFYCTYVAQKKQKNEINNNNSVLPFQMAVMAKKKVKPVTCRQVSGKGAHSRRFK